MSSGLFDLYLPLNNPSKAYRRLGGMVWVSTLFISIKYADPPILISVMIGMCLLYALWQLFRCAYPHAKLQSLRFERELWIIEDRHHHCIAYNAMRIVVDTGFYVLLHLSGDDNRARLLIVFYDQIPISALRQLNRLTKIKRTTSK